jgi:hypothetical protein
MKGNLIAIIWKGKQNVNILPNMHSQPLEHGKDVKLDIIQKYIRHMGYVY